MVLSNMIILNVPIWLTGGKLLREEVNVFLIFSNKVEL
jgi:hypothetical protein